MDTSSLNKPSSPTIFAVSLLELDSLSVFRSKAYNIDDKYAKLKRMTNEATSLPTSSLSSG